MAKVQFSVAVGDLRNKAGGAVFTKTKFGSMVRRKVSPTQPRSSSQMNVRANFTALSKLWSDPTMANYRDGWIGLAESYPVKDVFGQSQKLTGHQMFVRLNRALATLSISPILIPPASLSVGYPGVITPTHDGPPVTFLKVDAATDNTAAEGWVLSATAGISAGRSSAGARFRIIAAHTDLFTGAVDIYGEYLAKFGAPITGRQIFFRLHYVTKATGAQSLASEASITI
jgi:hypothetical protein